MVRCPECGNIFNDATCWTVCPHNSLKAPQDLPYCRRHNLYNCKLCPTVLPEKMSEQEWDGQYFGQVRMVGSKFAPQLLIAEQKFRRIVEYHNKRYMVTAWTPADGSPYVEAETIYDGSRSKDDTTRDSLGILSERINETCQGKPEKTSVADADRGDDIETARSWPTAKTDL